MVLHAVDDGFLQICALLSKSSNWLCVFDKCTTCWRLKYQYHASYNPTQQNSKITQHLSLPTVTRICNKSACKLQSHFSVWLFTSGQILTNYIRFSFVY